MEDRSVTRYTLREEFANGITHGLSALAAAVGTGVMLTMAVINGSGRAVLARSAFGRAMILMYTMSTLYHIVQRERLKRVFRIFDHAAISLLIAGSYTPFCLIVLQGSPKGGLVAAVVWLCAVLAIAFNFINLEKFEKITLVIYVVMGWSALLALKDILAALPAGGFRLLLSGGLSYTVGIVFYKMTKVKYMHAVWHCFVSLGTLLHFLCVVVYVLPMA